MQQSLKSQIAKTLALGGLTAGAFFVTQPAEAAILSVNGIDYNVTIVTGSYNELASQLQATPWWGNTSLSLDLANAAVSEIGFVQGTYNNQTPFFAIEEWRPCSWCTHLYSKFAYSQGEGFTRVETLSVPFYLSGGNVKWAVGSAVPEPLTILGSITAAGFGVAFKRKKNSNKED